MFLLFQTRNLSATSQNLPSVFQNRPVITLVPEAGESSSAATHHMPRNGKKNKAQAEPPPHTFRAPTQGRRLGGGANGGVSPDELDALRRARLAGIARQERKARLSSGGAATKDPRATLSAEVSNVEHHHQGSESTFDVDVGVRTYAIQSVDDPLLLIKEAEVEAGEACSAMVKTLGTVLRNARERADRRILKASNIGVWSKIVKWRSGRALLEAAGFVCLLSFPDDGARSEQRVEEWRNDASYSLVDQSNAASSDLSASTISKLASVESIASAWSMERASACVLVAGHSTAPATSSTEPSEHSALPVPSFKPLQDSYPVSSTRAGAGGGGGGGGGGVGGSGGGVGGGGGKGSKWQGAAEAGEMPFSEVGSTVDRPEALATSSWGSGSAEGVVGWLLALGLERCAMCFSIFWRSPFSS